MAKSESRHEMLRVEANVAPDAPAPHTGAVVCSDRPDSIWRWVAVAALVAVLAAAAYRAWQEIAVVQSTGAVERLWWFGASCALAGVALRALNALTGNAGTLSHFVPALWRDPPPAPRDWGTRLLVVAAVASLAGCLALVRLRPAEQAGAAALWAMAQVWILAAAWPPARATPQDGAARSVQVGLAIVLLGAVVLRFWQLGFFPDSVHHDHVLYGQQAASTLHGAWHPFFARLYSVGRPALLPLLAALQVFGLEYWVLRLPAAAAGVAVVWGTYLLGQALFNRRTGLIAALLVAVNHVLLLYSRQPYVIEPVAPFVFSLYCAATGLQRGSRFHGCLAGVFAGWALLTYYVSMTYVPIGGAMLLYLAVRYPRHTWRSRAVLLWLVAGACAVYLPMIAAESVISQRASTIVVFFNPDGSLRWDAALWATQLGRSYGAILYWGSGAWGVWAATICVGAAACLFGIGLIYLLQSWRTPATAAVLAIIALSIFFGSVLLPSPPTDYHFLAGIVAILLAAAVALDRTLALADGGPRIVRAGALVTALALLSLVAATDLRAAWNAVRRPLMPDGQIAFRTGADVMAARFIGEHRAYRHYLVRTRHEVSAISPIMAFFNEETDLSDLSRGLRDVLPVAPVPSAAGASFIVLPGRAADRPAIEAVYPGAEVREVSCYDRTKLWIYLVDAESVRAAYAARHATDP